MLECSTFHQLRGLAHFLEEPDKAPPKISVVFFVNSGAVLTHHSGGAPSKHPVDAKLAI